MSAASKSRRGFTLVELLVVIAIIGTLVAILIPALSRARSSANASASKSNLSSYGKGFELYASTHDGVYSSGAFDHFRDGDIRQYGWVGDMIGGKVANPGKGLGPAHRSPISVTVGDYTGALTANQGNITQGVTDGRWPTGTAAGTVVGAAHFGGAPQAKDLWDEGFNTNYLTTWHFSRGDPSAADGYSAGTKAISDGDGPLSQNIVSQSNTTAARIAIMSTARPITAAAGLIDAAQATALKSFTGTSVAKANDRYTMSMTDGMVVPYTDATFGGSAGAFVHDLGGIYPVHQPKTAEGAGGFAPVLFADGHVESVYDKVSFGDTTKGDGYIGNGPNAPGAATTLDLDADMYQEASDLIWIKRLRTKL